MSSKIPVSGNQLLTAANRIPWLSTLSLLPTVRHQTSEITDARRYIFDMTDAGLEWQWRIEVLTFSRFLSTISGTRTETYACSGVLKLLEPYEFVQVSNGLVQDGEAYSHLTFATVAVP